MTEATLIDIIQAYIKSARKDLKEAETEEEKRLSLYLITELQNILFDFYVKRLQKEDLK